MKSTCLLLFVPTILFFSCKKRQPLNISFYYWKTNFDLNTKASTTLTNNNVEKLYVRYFDVDKEPGQSAAKPVSPIGLNDSITTYNIIPVIYIRKRVFENTDSTALVSLAINVQSLLGQINSSKKINTTEVQFDCDWTEQTKANYFSFLRSYHHLSKQKISATIRLHQVKYAVRTGVPPVDRGVLMYYNMGEINSGTKNSIYDKSIAAKYITWLSHYPLPLDIALPIFAWGQLLRNGQVVSLLNKVNIGHFTNDTNFVVLTANRLFAKHACFKAGYYFQQNDEIKLESVSKRDLLDMSADINKFLKIRPQTIIFYDLDSINIVRYDEYIYKEILDRFN